MDNVVFHEEEMKEIPQDGNFHLSFFNPLDPRQNSFLIHWLSTNKKQAFDEAKVFITDNNGVEKEIECVMPPHVPSWANVTGCGTWGETYTDNDTHQKALRGLDSTYKSAATGFRFFDEDGGKSIPIYDVNQKLDITAREDPVYKQHVDFEINFIRWQVTHYCMSFLSGRRYEEPDYVQKKWKTGGLMGNSGIYNSDYEERMQGIRYDSDAGREVIRAMVRNVMNGNTKGFRIYGTYPTVKDVRDLTEDSSRILGFTKNVFTENKKLGIKQVEKLKDEEILPAKTVQARIELAAKCGKKYNPFPITYAKRSSDGGIEYVNANGEVDGNMVLFYDFFMIFL